MVEEELISSEKDIIQKDRQSIYAGKSKQL